MSVVAKFLDFSHRQDRLATPPHELTIGADQPIGHLGEHPSIAGLVHWVAAQVGDRGTHVTPIHDLPDRLHPACHRLKEHSYHSVYGRLFWDKPAQTITSGFGCMGQGRYVHPKEPRTITPHEAARLQFIPDFFQFGSDVPRTVLAEMIANAVPLKLTYCLPLELLRS